MSVASPRRALCGRCDLPVRTCVCAFIPRVRNEVDVLVLQHPDEVDQAKGTARLLRLGLARCRVLVGEAFDPTALLALLDGDVAGSTLLYPSDTLGGTPTTLAACRPRRLVVLDGTWRKSLRMLHANPLLQTLPRWSLSPSGPSRYGALRKAGLASQLSTLEATCAALRDIESATTRYEPLLAALDRFVAERVRFVEAQARPQ
jgi:DTW domain-containing protein YfiP